MNCKLGDLAYIIGAENAGAVVEVIVCDEYWSSVEGVPFCVVESRSPLHAMDLDGNPTTMTRRGSIADSRLRPISGVPVHDEQLDEVTA